MHFFLKKILRKIHKVWYCITGNSYNLLEKMMKLSMKLQKGLYIFIFTCYFNISQHILLFCSLLSNPHDFLFCFLGYFAFQIYCKIWNISECLSTHFHLTGLILLAGLPDENQAIVEGNRLICKNVSWMERNNIVIINKYISIRCWYLFCGLEH